MPITGLTFLLFALGAVVLYYLFPKRLRQYVLLAASILFYLTYGVRMAGYLAATVLLTYLFGLWLDRLAAFRPAAETKEERKRLKRANDRKKRRVLALALVLNFASLVLLKYGGFLVSSVNALLSVELTLPRFLLPLGISFYIFQTSAYLIDISRGKHRAERGFLRYALFVCYFPQMVQGPINRFAALQPQLTEGNDFSWDNIQHGFLRLLYGVLKKAMIADALAPIVAKIYGGYASYPGIICFLGAALYCVQLYCDFSGGIDLMMGISRLFGISMQENFCRPYFSVSLSDFWRRWHISLGEWMKDYLFYPLALSKPFGKLAQLCRRHMPPDAAPWDHIVVLPPEKPQKPAWAGHDQIHHAARLQLDRQIVHIPQPAPLADVNDLLVAQLGKPVEHPFTPSISFFCRICLREAGYDVEMALRMARIAFFSSRDTCACEMPT